MRSVAQWAGLGALSYLKGEACLLGTPAVEQGRALGTQAGAAPSATFLGTLLRWVLHWVPHREPTG
jgi:hypothetical protein